MIIGAGRNASSVYALLLLYTHTHTHTYIYIYIYIYMKTLIVVTNSLCRFIADLVRYNLESAQYVGERAII